MNPFPRSNLSLIRICFNEYYLSVIQCILQFVPQWLKVFKQSMWKIANKSQIVLKSEGIDFTGVIFGTGGPL